MGPVIATSADAAGEPVGTTKYGWRVVLFSGAGWFFDGYVINVWPLAIPFVMTDLHLTVESIGTITTLYVTAYMLGTLLGGTFADYLGRRSVLSFSVLFYMFVDALTALAQGFWSLGFFRILTGTGTGMELPVGSTFITEAVDNRWRARLISIMNAGYPAGYVLAIGAFATIGAVWGWRGVFAASIIPGIIVFIVRRKVSESPHFQEAQERLARGEVKRDKVSNITVFRRPYLRDSLPAVLYWVGNAFAFWAFYTFIPLYLVKVRQISAPVELTWLATYQVWAFVITYLASWLSDRWGRRPFAILFAGLTLIFVWAVTLVPNGAPLYLAGALLFGFNNATWCISFAHSTELFPTHIRGSGIGTTMACGRIVSILAPMFFGVVAARYGIAVAFRLGALAWIFTIIGYLLSRETSGIALERIEQEAALATAQSTAALLPQPSE
ncbi:MAG TPA: MFS transporter [Stellaceae bacterium]|nr:MFS transporter [Stellaceae bacterium]